DWWKRLDDGSKNLLKIFGALLVAWRLLNSAFLKSPIGIITTLILAIGLLYDDYQTWKEGGKSLIDWSKWEPAIEKAKKAILWLRDKLLGLKDSVGGWQNSLEILATFIAGAWLSKITSAFAKLAGIPMPPWLKLWAIYAGYLVDDRHNIKDSAKSSLNYTKRNIGDALRWMGIDTDFGRNPNTVHGTPEVALDIPGNSPSQNSASANHQKVNEIAPHERDEIKNRQQAANGYLEKISDGIAKIGNLLFSPAGAAEISPNIPGDPSQLAQSVKRPQATAQGKVLLDWMGPMFNKLESLYQLPAGLLKSVAITESGGNQFATSGAGAKGLFQFMDGTARDMGLRGNDVFDPEKSAQAAAKYLSQLLRQNGGDLSKALASYNWGIG
ncbi:lytic transglycosylase domain-containing protein, partial [Enterobacter hormaechei]